MSDLADEASVLEQRHRDQALARQLELHAPRPVRLGTICRDCGQKIDRKRLMKNPGALRCALCQGDHETLQRRSAC